MPNEKIPHHHQHLGVIRVVGHDRLYLGLGLIVSLFVHIKIKEGQPGLKGTGIDFHGLLQHPFGVIDFTLTGQNIGQSEVGAGLVAVDFQHLSKDRFGLK